MQELHAKIEGKDPMESGLWRTIYGESQPDLEESRISGGASKKSGSGKGKALLSS